MPWVQTLHVLEYVFTDDKQKANMIESRFGLWSPTVPQLGIKVQVSMAFGECSRPCTG
jgi:hypothetical protein